jgi:hypothetical protein
MRIALYHNLPSGGAKRAVFEWTRRLADKHIIDVYTLESANHDFCDIRPFVNKHNVYSFVPRKSFDSPFGRLNQLQRWLDLGELQKLNQKIANEINQGGYDILFANTDIFTRDPCGSVVYPYTHPFITCTSHLDLVSNPTSTDPICKTTPGARVSTITIH